MTPTSGSPWTGWVVQVGNVKLEVSQDNRLKLNGFKTMTVYKDKYNNVMHYKYPKQHELGDVFVLLKVNK